MIIKEVTAMGKDVIEAQENAKAALGVSALEDVKFEVIDGGTKGILGLFARPAKVRAYIEGEDAPEKKPQQRHEKRRESAPRHEGNRGNDRRDGAKKNEGKKPQEKKADNKPKSRVIPEVELKMELREVKAGEDMSYDFVTTVIKDIGLNAEAVLYSCEDGTRRINIVGEDAATLIGHHGDTLDAIQYLANLASAQKNANGERDKSRVTIDIEGYRAKREDTLRALAHRMAAKALRNKRSVMLEPMTAYERRIIHSEVQNIEGVSTNSIGADNNRKVVIYLTDKKPAGIFEEENTEAEESTSAFEAAVTSDLSPEEQANETVAVEQTAPADDLVIVDDEEVK